MQAMSDRREEEHRERRREKREKEREKVHLMHYRFPGPVGYLFPDSVASSADASHTGGGGEIP